MNERGRLWLVTAIVAVVSALILCCGCSLGYPPNDPHVPLPAPTVPIAVRLAEPFQGKAHVEAPFELRLNPPVVMQGGSMWVTCYVPHSYGRGRIALAFDGTGYQSERDIDFIERKVLIERIPCGTWLAVCQIRTQRGIERREQKIESKGPCNESG